MGERDDLTEQAYHTPVTGNVTTLGGAPLVELGDQVFTRDEWDVVQSYAKGMSISALQDADMQGKVEEFHRAFNSPASDTIRRLPEERIGVRVELIREEFIDELIPALEAGDLVETVDACIDILYVTFGLLVEMGVDAQPLFDEVHRSNMSKLGEDGKPIISRGTEIDGVYEGRVMKGPHYFRPNIAGILNEMILQQKVLANF